MRALIDISIYRRAIQEAYNTEHGITPRSVVRAVQESLHVIVKGSGNETSNLNENGSNFDVGELIRELESDMAEAAGRLEYERAALLRDQINELKTGASPSTLPTRRKVSYKKPSRKKRG
jgi:excinuclease ABC subunit B